MKIFSALLLFIGLGSAVAQDFTLTPYQKVKSDIIYEGSVITNGDSVTVTFQGMDGTLLKDFAVSTAPGVIEGTTAVRDTLVWTDVVPSFVRVKVVDSTATRYSNYVDVSMGNGSNGSFSIVTDSSSVTHNTVAGVYYSFQLKARTAGTRTLIVIVRIPDIEVLPIKFLN